MTSEGRWVTGVTSHPLPKKKKNYINNITSQATLLAMRGFDQGQTLGNKYHRKP